MANFVCCLNLFLAVLALCTLQGDATDFTKVEVSFKQSEYTVKESDGRVAITIKAARRYYTSFYVKIRASVNKYLRPYASPYDFEESIQTVKFSSRQSTATVYIKIKDDNRVESTEAFQVEILISRDTYLRQGVRLGNPSKAKVFIKDDDKVIVTKPPATMPPATRPPSNKMSVRVGFEFGRYEVKESCTLLPVTLVVKGEVLRPFTVGVSPVELRVPSAIAGRDFVSDVLKVNIQPGQSRSSICIVIIDDDIRERTEKFRLLLSIPYSARALGVRTQYPYYADVLIIDDVDDGRGLPVQLPPTYTERAKMCICKPRPTLPPPTTPSPTTPSPTTPPPGFTVMFNDNNFSGAEADGVIAVTIVATGVSSMSYTVTITPSELIPVSAREVLDYSNDIIVVTFNPGEISKTVFVVINADCLREGPEFFNLTLSLDPPAMDLGITLGDPSVAVAEIEDTDIIFVNFSQPLYEAAEADEMMIITVEADGFSVRPYVVEINPIERLPVGSPFNAQGNGIDFVSDTLIALFNPGDTQVNVSLPIIRDQVFERTERLNLTLTVPDNFSDLNGRLLIKPGSNDFAEGDIIDSNTLVSFGAQNFTAIVNATFVEIFLFAVGPFDFEFRVQVVPDDLPKGVNQFFNPEIREAFFPVGAISTTVEIELFPELVGDMDLQFIIRLVVPDEAMSQGVVLGGISAAIVNVPSPQ